MTASLGIDTASSRLIKGGWQLAGGHGAVDRAQALADMIAFADAGITTFDCADIYTGVEELIGEFLRAWRERHGPAEARRIRVHTKYVPDLGTLARLTPRDVEHGIDRSLARLGVDAIDLVQFHWWDYGIPGFVEAGYVLDRLRRAGKIRHIGLTNCDIEHVRLMLDAGVPVVAHQVQFSVLDRRPAAGMTSLCRERGVALLGYGALAGGFIAERWLGSAEPRPPLEHRSLVKYRLIIDEFGGWELFQRLLTALAAIGARHGVRIGTVALRWTLDRPGVSSVIVGARHASHLPDLLAALALRLEPNDYSAIAAVLAESHGPAGDVYALERDRHGPHGRIMRYDLNESR